MNRISIIGGGAAGMMAAVTAAENGASVTLIERNEKLGSKLNITGKGRCNLTNNTDIQGLMAHTLSNPRFMNSAFRAMDSQALMDFFTDRKIPLKTERGGRVFPVSDKAADITNALESAMRQHKVKILTNTRVKSIAHSNGVFSIATERNGKITAEAVIIATGGLSYPTTGSTGDGYALAKSLGHTITPTTPALVPLVTAEPWVAALEGLSLKNVRATLRRDKKILYEETGEMLFSANGVTGPIILRASSYIGETIDDCLLSIDLKPALSHEQLDNRILRDFSDCRNKNFANALDGLLPKRLIETIVALSEIPPEQKVNAITRPQRTRLVSTLKNLPLTPLSTAGFNEAVITRGGVNVREINPSTLMSKLVPGLFFAGEILDVDALTGGYNLQIAFSTGRLAGENAYKLKD